MADEDAEAPRRPPPHRRGALCDERGKCGDDLFRYPKLKCHMGCAASHTSRELHQLTNRRGQVFGKCKFKCQPKEVGPTANVATTTHGNAAHRTRRAGSNRFALGDPVSRCTGVTVYPSNSPQPPPWPGHPLAGGSLPRMYRCTRSQARGAHHLHPWRHSVRAPPLPPRMKLPGAGVASPPLHRRATSNVRGLPEREHMPSTVAQLKQRSGVRYSTEPPPYLFVLPIFCPHPRPLFITSTV